MRNWGLDQVDEVTRREIYTAAEGGAPITRIFGVNLHDLDELGEGQEYQDFFVNGLGGALKLVTLNWSLVLTKVLTIASLCQSSNSLRCLKILLFHRQQRIGFYGFMELGFGVLDNRRIMLGSF